MICFWEQSGGSLHFLYAVDVFFLILGDHITEDIQDEDGLVFCRDTGRILCPSI